MSTATNTLVITTKAARAGVRPLIRIYRGKKTNRSSIERGQVGRLCAEHSSPSATSRAAAIGIDARRSLPLPPSSSPVQQTTHSTIDGRATNASETASAHCGRCARHLMTPASADAKDAPITDAPITDAPRHAAA